MSAPNRSTVVVLGASGMLGHRVVLEARKEFKVVATLRGSASSAPAVLDKEDVVIAGDIVAADVETIRALIAHWRPVAVVNCIGVIKQLPEGKDPIQTIATNALFPHQVAAICQAVGARFVHFSTDCVFSGERGPYAEEDVPDALDLYGRSKLLGEVGEGSCLTLRTSIIGHELERTTGLLEWFLSQKKTVSGYANALYSGLTTNELASLVVRVLSERRETTGVRHVGGEPISKLELLRLIERAYQTGTTIDVDTAFHCDRRLDSGRFRQEVGYRPPSWTSMIDEMHRVHVAPGE